MDNITKDKEIYNELLVEATELTESIIDNLIMMEKNIYSDKPVNPIYYSLIRDLHSLKGIAGLFLSQNIVNFIHSTEDLIIARFDKEELRNDLYDTLIQLFTKLLSFLIGDISQEKIDIDFEKYLLKDKIDEISVAKKELVFIPIQQLLVIGKNKNIIDALKCSHKNYCLYDGVNDFYHQKTSIHFAKFFFIDIDSIEMNPFPLHEIVHNLNPKIHFVYIASSTQRFGEYLAENNVPALSFCFLNANDKNFELEVSKLLKSIE